MNLLKQLCRGLWDTVSTVPKTLVPAACNTRAADHERALVAAPCSVVSVMFENAEELRFFVSLHARTFCVVMLQQTQQLTEWHHDPAWRSCLSASITRVRDRVSKRCSMPSICGHRRVITVERTVFLEKNSAVGERWSVNELTDILDQIEGMKQLCSWTLSPCSEKACAPTSRRNFTLCKKVSARLHLVSIEPGNRRMLAANFS